MADVKSKYGSGAFKEATKPKTTPTPSISGPYADPKRVTTTKTTTPAKTSTSGGNVNWTNVGLGVQFAGNLYSIFNEYSNSRAMAASYKQQAQDVLSEANTQVYFEKLNNEISQKAYISDRLELLEIQRKELGSLRTAFAGEGIEMSGSALEVMAEQGAQHAEDLYNLDRNAQLAAFQSQLNAESIMIAAEYKSRALNIQAKYAKKAGRASLIAGTLQSIGGLAYGIGVSK